MSTTYNIYCDESCHLQGDRQTVMVLGAVWCETAESRRISETIRRIKQEHGLSATFEVKWTKVSPAKLPFYRAILEFFFAEPGLHFRSLIIPDKSLLRHDDFGHDHDTWYYKMSFLLLGPLLGPKDRYRIYIDVKDTRSGVRIAKLHEVLCNSKYDFERTIIEQVQAVRSHQVEQIQLADFLAGLVGYANRELQTSAAKLELVEEARRLSGYSLTRTTLLRESKVNLFRWQAQGGRE